MYSQFVQNLCFCCTGGPVFTEIKEKNVTPDDKKRYRLHAINGGYYPYKKAKGGSEHWSVTVYVGNKREKYLDKYLNN